jgi:hypothetical protein
MYLLCVILVVKHIHVEDITYTYSAYSVNVLHGFYVTYTLVSRQKIS